MPADKSKSTRATSSRKVGKGAAARKPDAGRALQLTVAQRREIGIRALTTDCLVAEAETLGNFGIWNLNPATRRISLSGNLAIVLGVSPSHTISDSHYWRGLHPDDSSRIKAFVEESIRSGRPYRYSCRYHRPDGTLRHLSVIGMAVPRVTGKLPHSIAFIQDVTDQTKAGEELHQVTQQLIRARDDERRHMARELHESAGQTLVALKMTLGRLMDSTSEDNLEARELIANALDFTEDAVREVRTVSYLMHPPMLDEAGLSSAISWYARGFSQRSGIAVDAQISDQFGRLSREVETTLFRIVQEALTNVHRYSGSRTATIRVARNGDSVYAEIHDDGCGLPVPGRTNGKTESIGVGIAGMRERINQLNGTFEIASSPGRGTTVRASLPVTLPADMCSV